jgi:hypothetical protein
VAFDRNPSPAAETAHRPSARKSMLTSAGPIAAAGTERRTQAIHELNRKAPGRIKKRTG